MNPRILERIRDATEAEFVAQVVEAATELEKVYYQIEHPVIPEFVPYFFRLRKALEGVFGDDLPYETPYGE